MSTKTSYFEPRKLTSLGHTFCASVCINYGCMRHVSEYAFGGHHVPQADFAEDCADYVRPVDINKEPK